MNPLTFEQLVALGSLLLAAVTVALTLRRDSANANTLAAAWVCMSFKTSTGANLIVTVDEPIE